MNILQVINANETEPVDYEPRGTVKAVIINQENQVLVLGHFLIGGGMEGDETAEEALARECMEEAGVLVKIMQPLGTVIQYRDALKKRYEVFGFLAHYLKTVGKPTTTQEDEIGKVATWRNFDEVVTTLENRIEKLNQESSEDYEGDTYQAKLYNATTHLIFIKKAKEILGK